MKRLLFLSAWLVAGVMSMGTVRAGETDKQQQPETVVETADVADTIIYNAKVLTVSSNFTVAKAIAIRNGRIIAVGRDRQLEEYRGPNTWMFDAQGNTVMPGLYDANVQSYRAAVSELTRPVPVIDSITNAQNYIRSLASNKPPGAWIILNDIPPTRLKEGRLPTKEELDAATTSHPVEWVFGPTAVVNSKALEVSGITNASMSPADGEIVVDERHRRPTGLLRNTAASLLKIPAAQSQHTATTAQERAGLKKLYAQYNQQGITSIGESAATPEAIDLFRQMSKSNELTVRITAGRYFAPGRDADESIDRLATLLNGLSNAPAKGLPYGPTGVGDDWVRIGALQTGIDGNASMGTAYLRTPYGIGPTFMNSELAYRGVLTQDSFVLPQVYLAAAQQGWQISAHCEGDAALDFLLNAYQEVQFKTNISDKRFLIVDTEFQAAQDWKRCQDLGVAAILNPNGLYEDAESLSKTLGAGRLEYYTPMKGWVDRGMVIGGGSGHFAGVNSLNAESPWNPWLGMWVTLTRQTKEGTEINPKESLTREQAVKFYTYNNAWMNREENDRGSLEVGKLADLVLLDTDILKCPVDAIRNTKVLMTMVNGKVVWQAIEPIFQGPQVIPAVTVIVTNIVTNQTVIITPATPVASKTQPMQASQKTKAAAAFDPFAPIPMPDAAATNDVTATATDAAKNAAEVSTQQPVNATTDTTSASTPTVTSSNAATIVTVTVQTPSATNTTTVTTPTIAPETTTSAATTPTVTATPAAQTTPQTPTTATTPATVEKSGTADAAANGDNTSGVGGAAPAELQVNPTLPPTAAVSTNIAGPTAAPQTTLAATNAGPTVAPQTTVASTNAGPTTAAVTQATTVANSDQSTASASQIPVPAAATPPVAVAKATTTSGATTNQTDANDWSHLGNQNSPAGK